LVDNCKTWKKELEKKVKIIPNSDQISIDNKLKLVDDTMETFQKVVSDGNNQVSDMMKSIKNTSDKGLIGMMEAIEKFLQDPNTLILLSDTSNIRSDIFLLSGQSH
jgi:hypothetical protein